MNDNRANRPEVARTLATNYFDPRNAHVTPLSAFEAPTLVSANFTFPPNYSASKLPLSLVHDAQYCLVIQPLERRGRTFGAHSLPSLHSVSIYLLTSLTTSNPYADQMNDNRANRPEVARMLATYYFDPRSAHTIQMTHPLANTVTTLLNTC
jgi:hypothetical protein